MLSVYQADTEHEVSLADLWRVLYDGKWIVVLVALSCAILSAVAAFTLTPVYRAQVLMAPVAEDGSRSGIAALAGQLGGLAAFAGLQPPAGANTALGIATLESRALTEQFIRERNLMPVLFPDAGGSSDNDVDVGEGSSDAPTIGDAYSLFDSIRAVTEDVQTGLVTLTVDWPDAEVAADWANGLVAQVNERLRNDAIEEAQQNLEFLEGQLDNYSAVAVREAVFNLMEAEMKNAMLANVRAEYAFEVIDPAVVPERRFKPRRLLMVVVGSVAGCILGFLAVFLRNARNSARTTARDDS